MNRLSKKNMLLCGITLFSMFFGAGNLIFPVFVGFQAGTASLPAFIGFVITAVGFPILGVAAVARAESLTNLANRVSKPFAAVFIMLIYLSIGPCLAIPRTAGTSFALAVTPFLPQSGNFALILQIIYSILFFAVALFFALRPAKLIDLLGKRMAPALLILILVLFIGSLVNGSFSINEPVAKYASSAVANGFLDGYQTMDAMAALIFGILLTMNIRERGVSDKKEMLRTINIAGIIAAVLFVSVYGILTFIGTVSGADAMSGSGADVISYSALKIFGKPGLIILAAIFVIACLNTCISLICSCAEYFHNLFPKISYTVFAVFFAVASAIISIAGLNLILQISVPILGFLYPMALVLILMAFLPMNFHINRPLLYPLTVALTGIVSVISALSGISVQIPFVTRLFSYLPLFDIGLGWIIPAAVGFVIGTLVKRKNISVKPVE